MNISAGSNQYSDQPLRLPPSSWEDLRLHIDDIEALWQLAANHELVLLSRQHEQMRYVNDEEIIGIQEETNSCYAQELEL